MNWIGPFTITRLFTEGEPPVNWISPATVAWIVLAALIVARAIWTFRRHDSHRLARFVGWPTDARGRLGKFYFWEGTFSSEVDRAMSPEYAARYGWLLSHRSQRLLVVLNVASWFLCLIGALDLPWNLGFGESLFSWWFGVAIGAYLLLRASVRVVADAPDELLDERLVAVRHRAYVVAYRWLALTMGLAFGFTIGFAEADTATLDGRALWFGASILAFVTASLPSMVLAWSGSVKER